MGTNRAKPPRKARQALKSADGPSSPRATAWLERIADGVSLRAACAEAGLPWTTASRWMATDEAFAAKYAAAKQQSAGLWADKAGAILNTTAKKVDPVAAPGPYVTIQKARSEYARWRAGVMDRKTYGDKQQIEQDTTMRVEVHYVAPNAPPDASD